MIITRTPLRISFVGGGTDLPKYYENSESAGRVFSAAIDKYIYICLNQKFDGKIRVSYSKTETVTHASDLEHDIIREIFRYFGLGSGWEIVTVADIPGVGSGLGSSSALAVGLIRAIMKNSGVMYSYSKIAEIAYEIEREKCGHYCGKQDQYASAHGGMNEFGFSSSGQVFVRPMINAFSKRKLNESLLLFYIGQRLHQGILKKQNELMDEEKMKAMDCMANLAVDAMLDMSRGNPLTMGQLMDVNWELKRTLAPNISSKHIQKIYTRAMKAGAEGGKVLGQGGGGFMLFYVPEINQRAVIEAVGKRHVPFKFVDKGTQVIYAA